MIGGNISRYFHPRIHKRMDQTYWNDQITKREKGAKESSQIRASRPTRWLSLFFFKIFMFFFAAPQTTPGPSAPLFFLSFLLKKPVTPPSLLFLYIFIYIHIFLSSLLSQVAISSTRPPPPKILKGHSLLLVTQTKIVP